MKGCTMGYLPNGHHDTPYVVALLGQPSAMEVHDVLVKHFPQTRTSNTHRYLQIWKDRGWVHPLKETRRWTVTRLGLDCLQRRVVEKGWPEWLSNLGYEPQQMQYHERPTVLKGHIPVDPSIFQKADT